MKSSKRTEPSNFHRAPLQITQVDPAGNAIEGSKDRRGRPAKHSISDYFTPEEQNEIYDKFGDDAPLKLQEFSKERARRPEKAIAYFRKKVGSEVVILEEHRTQDGVAVLLTHDDGKSASILFTTFDPNDKSRRDWQTFSGEGAVQKAQVEFALLRKSSSEGHMFSDVLYYKNAVEEIFKSNLVDSMMVSSIPKRLGFILALFCHDKDWMPHYVRQVRRILKKTGNPEIPFPKRGEQVLLNSWLDGILNNLGMTERVRKGRIEIKRSSYTELTKIVRQAFSGADEKFGRFTTAFRAEKLIEELALRKAKQKVDEDHYPALPLKDVKLVLRHSLIAGLECYFAVILQLTTCLRNQEMGRLSKNSLCGSRKSMLLYQEPLYDNVYLIQKTLKKVDPKRDLSNPGVSLIGRVILKFYKFASQETVNSLFELGSELRNALSTIDGHQRTLRTTGATMLRFGFLTAIARPIDPKIIMQRMAQKTEQMVSEVYAKNLPIDAQDMDPDHYFSLGPIKLRSKFGVFEVGKWEYAWDLFLLRQVLSDLESFMEKGSYEEFKSKVIAEDFSRESAVVIEKTF